MPKISTKKKKKKKNKVHETKIVGNIKYEVISLCQLVF